MSDPPSLDGFVGGHAALDGLHPAPVLKIEEVSRSLREYPTILTLDEYHTPLLHRELYNINTSDITALPKTTTAFTCALGWKASGNNAFLKRAMAAERQRLVEGFVSSTLSMTETNTNVILTAKFVLHKGMGHSTFYVAL